MELEPRGSESPVPTGDATIERYKPALPLDSLAELAFERSEFYRLKYENSEAARRELEAQWQTAVAINEGFRVGIADLGAESARLHEVNTTLATELAEEKRRNGLLAQQVRYSGFLGIFRRLSDRLGQTDESS
jgi:hypothetical protein